MKKQLELANLKREYNSLQEKYERLGKYLADNEPTETGMDYYELMYDQLCAMRCYVNTLDTRIAYLEMAESNDKEAEKKEQLKEAVEEKPAKKEEEKHDTYIADMLKLTEALNALMDKARDIQKETGIE